MMAKYTNLPVGMKGIFIYQQENETYKKIPVIHVAATQNWKKLKGNIKSNPLIKLIPSLMNQKVSKFDFDSAVGSHGAEYLNMITYLYRSKNSDGDGLQEHFQPRMLSDFLGSSHRRKADIVDSQLGNHNMCGVSKFIDFDRDTAESSENKKNKTIQELFSGKTPLWEFGNRSTDFMIDQNRPFEADIANSQQTWVPHFHYKTIEKYRDFLLQSVEGDPDVNNVLASFNENIIKLMFQKETVEKIRCYNKNDHPNFFSLVPLFGPIIQEVTVRESWRVVFHEPFITNHYLYDFVSCGTKLAEKRNLISNTYMIKGGKKKPLYFIGVDNSTHLDGKTNGQLMLVNQVLADRQQLSRFLKSDHSQSHRKSFWHSHLSEKSFWWTKKIRFQYDNEHKGMLSRTYENWRVAFIQKTKNSDIKDSIRDLLCPIHRPEDIDQDRGYLQFRGSISLFENDADTILGYFISPKKRQDRVDSRGIVKPIRSPSALLSPVCQHLTFLEHNNPKRALLAAKHIGQSLPLLNREIPICTSSWLEDELFGPLLGADPETALYSKENRAAFGVHLITAFIIDPRAHEDGFLISESAAKKLSYIKVKEKDVKSSEKSIQFYENSPEWERSTEFRGKKTGINDPFSMKRFIKVSDHAVEEGDKLSNRHGTKGVITKILPDNEMPKTIIDGNVVTADIIVNSYSFLKRGSLGIFFEGALSLYGWIRKVRFSSHPYFSYKWRDQQQGSYSSIKNLLAIMKKLHPSDDVKDPFKFSIY